MLYYLRRENLVCLLFVCFLLLFLLYFVLFLFLFFQIIGSLVEVYGTVTFANNEVSNGAALQLLSQAQIRLHSGALVEFESNTGR